MLEVAKQKQPPEEPAQLHPSHRPVAGQQQRVRKYAGSADAYAMFNLLTGPQLLDRVEALLPKHGERLFPPTETLSLFLA